MVFPQNFPLIISFKTILGFMEKKVSTASSCATILPQNYTIEIYLKTNLTLCGREHVDLPQATAINTY